MERDTITKACAEQRELDARALELTNAELLLIAGEMTAQELRTVQAVLAARARAIRHPEHDLLRKAQARTFGDSENVKPLEAAMRDANPLSRGAFVRVKEDSPFRPGQDGMVAALIDEQRVGLVFGFDRHNRAPGPQGIVCTGLVEEWRLDELDLDSVSA